MLRAHPPELVARGMTDDVGDEEEMPDQLERFARTGFDALGRFGAEIEAAIVGRRPSGGTQPRETEPVSPGDAAQKLGGTYAGAAKPSAPPVPRSVAELDVIVRHQLADEGIVVRGHDVARAVAVATGRTVVWRAPMTTRSRVPRRGVGARGVRRGVEPRVRAGHARRARGRAIRSRRR